MSLWLWQLQHCQRQGERLHARVCGRLWVVNSRSCSIDSSNSLANVDNIATFIICWESEQASVIWNVLQYDFRWTSKPRIYCSIDVQKLFSPSSTTDSNLNRVSVILFWFSESIYFLLPCRAISWYHRHASQIRCLTKGECLFLVLSLFPINHLSTTNSHNTSLNRQ